MQCRLPERRTSPAPSEGFNPGPELHFPGPGAAVLAMDGEIGLGDRVRGQPAILRLGLLSGRGRSNGAIDDEMRDVDVLRRQFTGHGLGQPAQAEFWHGKTGGAANPFTLAVAPVKRIEPDPRATRRRAACWP